MTHLPILLGSGGEFGLEAHEQLPEPKFIQPFFFLERSLSVESFLQHSLLPLPSLLLSGNVGVEANASLGFGLVGILFFLMGGPPQRLSSCLVVATRTEASGTAKP